MIAESSLVALALDRVLVERVGWTLLHFLWQGSVVAGALALLDVTMSRGRAQGRYLAGCVALLLMLALPIATFLVSSPPTGPVATATPALTGMRAEARAMRRAAMLDAARASDGTRHASDRSHSARPVMTALRARPLAPALLPWLVGLWAAGVALLSIRLLGGWWLVHRLGRSAHNVPIAEWQLTASRLASRMGITRRVQLVRSALVTVPTAIGWLRPMVLLPASTLIGLAPAQIEAILAHELAHVRRYDYLVNLLQCMIETLLFYHPAVWWVSRRIREERELCCDDLAIAASGDRVTYARALCELERLRGEGGRLALAATGGSLGARIARLLGAVPDPGASASRGVAWALIASLVLAAGVAGGAVRVSESAPAAFARLAPVAALRTAAVAAGRAALAPLAAVERARHSAGEAVEEIACKSESACPDAEAGTPAAEADEETLASSDSDEIDGETQAFSHDDWERLAMAGVQPGYVAELDRAGVHGVSADELISLVQHGVSAKYVGEVHRVMGEIDVDGLITLAQHGVSAAYVTAMVGKLGETSVDDLVTLAQHGVSTAFVKGLEDLELHDLSVEQLVALANSGVSLEWFASLQWMGYTDLTVERAIELRNAGLTPEYASALRVLGSNALSLDELLQMRNQGVEVEYAAALMGMIRKDLTAEQIIRLRQQGVTIQDVAAMNALGHGELSVDELITLRQQGVEPGYVAQIAAGGYAHLTVDDLVELRRNGVDGAFLTAVREAGLGHPDVDELVRLRRQGLPANGGK